MLSNPHAGTALELPWEQGFAAGFILADVDPTPPSPLSADAQATYSEGFQAGRLAINGMRVPPVTPPTEVGTWESLLEFGAEHGVEHLALEYAKEDAVKQLGAEVASEFTLAGALFFIVSVAIFGPDRSEPFFEEATLRALQRAAQQITDAGIATDNVELFLAVCDLANHALGTDDEVLRQGFWHGRVFLDFESAKNEGIAHGHPNDTVVLRFQTASPGLVEAIGIS